MSSIPPRYIRVNGQRYERREPVTAEGAPQDVWAGRVYVSETHSHHSPDYGDVVEEEGPEALLLEVMGLNREAVAGEITSRMRGTFRYQWNVNIDKRLDRLPLEEARKYLHENFNDAGAILQDVLDGKTVVLEDSTDAV